MISINILKILAQKTCIANFDIFRYTIHKTTKESMYERIPVIDTETNRADQVMSIGTVIADADTFAPVEI